MSRTTSGAVEKIIEVESGDDLAPFIETAASMVDQIAVHANAPSATRLEIIERWLSAHYYAIFKQRAASEKAGPVSENKQYWLSYGLQTTMHGTQALMLDPTGILAEASEGAKNASSLSKRKPSMIFLGTRGNLSVRERN